MSPAHAAAKRVTYILLFAAFLLVVSAGGLAVWTRSIANDVARLNNQIVSAQRQSYKGCLRGNTLREAARYALRQLGSDELASSEDLAMQPCARLYPAGVNQPKGAP